MNHALVLMGAGGRIPDGPKLERHGITGLVYEARDTQRCNAATFAEIRKYIPELGVMRDPIWGQYPPPATYAGQLSADISRVCTVPVGGKHIDKSFGSKPMQCDAMMDIETKDMLYVEAAIVAFRRLRNKRRIIWTLEGHQGGILKSAPTLVSRINADPNIVVVPQAYDKDMVDWDEAAIVDDILAAGVKHEKVRPFIGIRHRQPAPWWQGIVYLENWEYLS